MPSVDNRVVRMEFDNAAFERKIQQTLTSLKKLDESLKMKNASKGMQEINTAAKKVDVTNVTRGLQNTTQGLVNVSKAAQQVTVDTGSISKGIEGVSKGFVAMGAVAVTAISSITTGALNAGLGAIQRSVATITEGFSEYETQIGSVQTILANTASKGTTIDQVNEALQNLNVYSDKTIYNFGQMAKNIGTFTAAGLSLDVSTESIKGIANLAAFSGSTAEQASGLMYQLSQAMAAGKLAGQDWISVVNAGVAGEGFKVALFEAAKAVGTLADVPAEQSFQEWTAAGNNFKATMSEGVFTSEALTLALRTFTGDMSKADLIAAGFSETIADQFLKTGQIATDSATKVKTFTQLIGTLKEAIGTGWADSFKIVIGGFEEARELFTNISTVLGGFISKVSEARNTALQAWKDLGGRNVLIEGLNTAFTNLVAVFNAVRKAFRDVFPRKTGKELFEMTKGFTDLMHALKPSPATLKNISRIFRGMFSILSIGWTVIKEGAKFFANLFRAIAGAGGPGLLGFLANIGDLIYSFRNFLVEGGGIAAFFDTLFGMFSKILPVIERVKDAISDFFANLFGGAGAKASSGASNGLDKLGEGLSKLEPLTERVQRRFESLKEIFGAIGRFLGKVGSAIGTVVSEVFGHISQAFSGGNFNKILDALNTGLFAGAILIFRKFVKDGLKLDFTGGLTDKIGKTFETLTGTLKSFQLSIKADALMRIAKALLLLAAAIVVLSLVDSEDLAKALAALAVGMGQLIGVLAALDKLDLGQNTLRQFIALSAGMILIGGAMLLLAASAQIMSSMGWEEMIRGLTGMGLVLGGFIGAVKLMDDAKEDLTKVAGSLILLGISIFFISRSVAKFAKMDMDDLVKGLTGFGVSLGGVVAAMRAMPEDMTKRTKGLASFGVAINLIAFAVKQFAGMSWEEMIKGFVGLGVALAGIVIAMKNMPTNMAAMAPELIAIGIAINLMAFALKQIAGIGGEDLITGILGMGAALAILAIAANAMQGSIAGAAAMLVVAGAVVLLGIALKAVSVLDWDDLLSGLLKIAVVLGAFALAALLLQPAIPAMIGLSIALGILGAAIALIGIGALAVAKSFEVFGRVGPAAFDNFEKGIKSVIKLLPTIFNGIAEGFIETVKMVLKAAPELIKGFTKVFSALLDVVIELIPKFQEVLGELILAGMATVRTFASQYVETGLFILLELLRGIRDSIGEVVTVVGEIITGFLDAFATQVPSIVTSLVNLFTTILTSVATAVGTLMATLGPQLAIAFMDGFLTGLETTFGRVWTFFTELPGRILDLLMSLFGINSPATTFINIGTDLILGLLKGIEDTIGKVWDFFSALPGKVLGFFFGAIGWLVDIGEDIIQGLWNGMGNIWDEVKGWLRNFLSNILDRFTGAIDWLFDVGKEVMQGLWNGMISIWNRITGWLSNLNPANWFNGGDGGTITGMLPGEQKAEEGVGRLFEDEQPTLGNETAQRLSNELSSMREFNPTITPVLDLTRVEADSRLINSMLAGATIGAGLSLDQANAIATTPQEIGNLDSQKSPAGDSTPTFQQNIYAPDRLSMADIYKQTKNQIAMAKEELKI